MALDLSAVYQVVDEAENGKEFDLGDGAKVILRSSDSEAYNRELRRIAQRFSRAKTEKAREEITIETMAKALWLGGSGFVDDGKELDVNDFEVRKQLLRKYRTFRNELSRMADTMMNFATEQQQD